VFPPPDPGAADRFLPASGGRGRRVIPDDERSQSPGLYVAVGLLSLGLVALGLAFLVVPPAFAAHLVLRGARAELPWLRVAGYLLFAGWFVALLLLGRRVMGRRAPPSED
jgi:hypothetical protein